MHQDSGAELSRGERERRKGNLNAGPWAQLEEKRRQERARNRHAFRCFMSGYDAKFRGELIFAPHFWNDADRKQFRDGWEAADREIRRRREFAARMPD